MTGREVLRRLRRQGCEQVRQTGSHVTVRCPGGCQTVVPAHRRDLRTGTLGAIRKDLRECLGDDW